MPNVPQHPIPIPAVHARLAGADPLPVLATRPASVGIEELVALTTEPGGVIVTEWLDEQTVARANDEIDRYLNEHPGHGAPDSGSELYDLFLGRRTVRLHGLVAKLPRTGPALIADPHLVEWATAVMAPMCTSVLLNAGELIQIGPGEGTQILHRDSGAWPALQPGPTPVIVNAIIALDEFTLDNGATHVALGSHHWPAERTVRPGEIGRSVMRAGDVLLFRGDLVHGGGANTTDRRRRAISISYCVGWLRPVENHPANLGLDAINSAPRRLRDLLGGGVHDATAKGGGILGLVEGRNPAKKR